MSSPKVLRRARRTDSALGFSLLEMLVSIAIIMLLMSAVFPFLFQAQKRFQGNVVVSESNQSARAALEVMSQEIGQAGYNPQFFPNKTSSTPVDLTGIPYWCITVSDLNGINPGDWVSVDTGANNELLEVFATSTSNGVTTSPNPCQASPAPVAPWIQVKPLMNHKSPTSPMPYSIASYKMPYSGGLLVAFDTSGNLITTPDCTSSSPPCALSNGQRLEFYGDINEDGNVNYVVYSISPMVPATTVSIGGTTYTLYNLYRSITSVPFPSLPTPSTYPRPNNQPASPMVEKVLFNAAAGTGPTGQPIFSFPNTITVGVIPNQITVVGTIVITLCVAVNPKSLESSQVQWYTMATQIRPLNLTAAINVNNSSGGLYLPPSPKSLPMALPVNYYP